MSKPWNLDIPDDCILLKTGAGRLLITKRCLLNNKPEHNVVFNMNQWCTLPHTADCCTQACIAGHAANIPAFNRLGLTFDTLMGVIRYVDPTVPDYRRGHINYDALRCFYDLPSLDDAYHLFSPETYGKDVRDVDIAIRRIDQMILKLTKPQESQSST